MVTNALRRAGCAFEVHLYIDGRSAFIRLDSTCCGKSKETDMVKGWERDVLEKKDWKLCGSSTGRRWRKTGETERERERRDKKKEQRSNVGGDATDSEAESKGLGNGWVKGALVPIKSHYSRLIMQGSFCFHRYKQWLCTWIIQLARRTHGSKDTVAYGWALMKAPRTQNAAGKRTS